MDGILISMPNKMAVAFAVIEGKLGNGEERRQKLKKLGYNPDDVQQVVNQLIKMMGEA